MFCPSCVAQTTCWSSLRLQDLRSLPFIKAFTLLDLPLLAMSASKLEKKIWNLELRLREEFQQELQEVLLKVEALEAQLGLAARRRRRR